MLGRFNKAPAGLGQPRWPESRIGGSMAAMKRVFLAAALLSALPSLAAAADLRPYYVDHCWNGRIIAPQFAELTTTPRGELLWNGVRADWTTFRAWLDDILKKRDPDWGLYVKVDEKMPHRKEIVAVLTKGGLTLRHCPALEPKPPPIP